MYVCKERYCARKGQRLPSDSQVLVAEMADMERRRHVSQSEPRNKEEEWRAPALT